MQESTLSIHDMQSRKDILAGFEHILGQKKDGQIVFGAANEPLRESQTEILTAIRDHIESNIEAPNYVGHIVAPGGSGKTRAGIAIGAAVAHHRRKTLFVVDRQESLQKFAEEARKLMPNVPIGEVYQEEKTLGDLTFITAASLRSRIDAWRNGVPIKDGAPIDPKTYDCVLWDEAHMYLTPNAEALKDEFAHCINLGFTATPRYYEGKEVADSFGTLIKEIPYKTAKKRGEVNNYDCFLVNTGITTGLTDLLPDQEESNLVAQVSNRRDRNLILADLYKNGRIDRSGKKEYLAGKPLLAFVANINHAHDLADAINEALMPALKSDTVFRQHLRDRGIDPDTVERIAAPIHSGSTEEHEGMSLDERNKIVEDYDARKTLMLISTSVLQQSFNSKKTEVVVDTVPRMTYVGAGQTGYRGTRTDVDKPDSILISFEDEDRPTLTFDDFIGARTRDAEQGTVFPMLERNGDTTVGLSALPEQLKNHPVAPYKIVGGKDMTKLLIKREDARTAERGRLVREDQDYFERSRHYTAQGYQHLHGLMVRIGQGDRTARNAFLTAIEPFVRRSAERIAEQVFGKDRVDDELVKEVVNDVLYRLIEDQRHFQGSSRSWANFSRRVQQRLRDEFKMEKARQSREEAFTARANTWGKDVFSTDAETDPAIAYEATDFAAATSNILDSLTPRQAEILKLRYGIYGAREYTLEEIGLIFGLTPDRIRQLEAGAIKKLKYHSRSDGLRTFLENASGTTTVHHDGPILQDDDLPVVKQPLAPDKVMVDPKGELSDYLVGIGTCRDRLWEVLAHKDGSRLNAEAFIKITELGKKQFHALMEANLHDDMNSRRLLRKEKVEIYNKLSAALKKLEGDTPDPASAQMLQQTLGRIFGLAASSSLRIEAAMEQGEATGSYAPRSNSEWRKIIYADLDQHGLGHLLPQPPQR